MNSLYLTMNIEKELLKEHSRIQTLKISTFIGSNTKRFDNLMTIFFDSHYRLNQRAAAILNKCHTNQPHLVTPYLNRLISNLNSINLHDAVKRNTLRILQFVELPEEKKGKVYTICFKYLTSSNEPIAIKAFSMRVLANICKTHPELKNELIPAIEPMIPYGSSGIKSRGEKILKELIQTRN